LICDHLLTSSTRDVGICDNRGQMISQYQGGWGGAILSEVQQNLAECAELLERVPANTGPMLPLNTRAGKDSRNKEEKMMNGNSENVSCAWFRIAMLSGRRT
jgi:hypothetical protein